MLEERSITLTRRIKAGSLVQLVRPAALLVFASLSGCDSGAQPGQPSHATETTRILQDRGFETAVMSDGNRASVHSAAIRNAFDSICARGQVPTDLGPVPCDEPSKYSWHVSLAEGNLVGIEFVHKDIVSTRYVASFGCVLQANEWVCDTLQE